MGKKPEPKTDRNDKIYQSYLDGVPAMELAKKYHLHLSRIYAIIEANKRKETTEKIGS